MKTEYLPTFIKDLKRLKSSASYQIIKDLVFTDILERFKIHKKSATLKSSKEMITPIVFG